MSEGFIQLVGIVCVLAGIFSGGIQFYQIKLPEITGWLRILLVALGVFLIFFPYILGDRTKFRVEDLDISWNRQSSSCDPKQRFTATIETRGGPGTVSYQLLIDGNMMTQKDESGSETAIRKLDVKESGRHPLDGEFSYDLKGLTSGKSRLEIVVVGPNEFKTQPSVLAFECKTGDTGKKPPTVKEQVQDFLTSYQSAVDEFGRSSSAVTGGYFQYPLQWYSQTFESETEFQNYLQVRKPGTSPCRYEAGRVTEVEDLGATFSVESQVDWSNKIDDRTGSVKVSYVLVRATEGQPFRITSAKQPSGQEECER